MLSRFLFLSVLFSIVIISLGEESYAYHAFVCLFCTAACDYDTPWTFYLYSFIMI